MRSQTPARSVTLRRPGTFKAGPATDGVLGSESALDGRWQGQYSPTTHNWGLTLQLAEPSGDGVTLRQVNTQWMRDKTQSVYLPQTVTAVAKLKNGSSVDVGTLSSKDVTGNAPGDAAGQFWFNLTAPTELSNVMSVDIRVKSGVPGWLFLGEIQAHDSQSINHALSKPYAMTKYNTLDYSDGEHTYPGSRAWSLTDGIKAPATGHTNPAWAGRWMGSKQYAPTNGTNAYLTLDLGAAQKIEKFMLGTYRDTQAAIHTPTSYRIRTAQTDGTWSTWSATTPIPAPANTARTELALAAPTSEFRYAQIHLTATANTILFLDELEAHTTHTVNAALGQHVTNMTGCPPSGGCNTTARTPEALQTLTSGNPFTAEWNLNNSPWANTITHNTANQMTGFNKENGVTYSVSFPEKTQINEITATWLEDYRASLMLPSKIVFEYLAEDGEWQVFGQINGQVSLPQEIPRVAVTWTYRAIIDTPVETTAIRVTANNGSLKPEGAKVATAGVAEITARAVESSTTRRSQ